MWDAEARLRAFVGEMQGLRPEFVIQLGEKYAQLDRFGTATDRAFPARR